MLLMYGTLFDCQREIKAYAENKRSTISLHKLRKKFLDTALGYTGVPYARRYHGPDCKLPTPLIYSTILYI